MAIYRLDDPIGPGDRAPDFTLPHASDGSPVNIYTRVGGGVPLVMFYPDAATLRAEADALTALARDMADTIVHPFIVVDAAADDPLPDPGAPFLVVRDTAGTTVSSFGLALDGAPVTLRFDPNLRLTGIRRQGSEAARHFFDLIRLRPAEPTPRLVNAVAPVLIIPHVLMPDVCQELIAVHDTRGNVPSTVTYNKDGTDVQEVVPDHKVRHDHIIEDPALMRRLDDAFQRRVNIEIAKAFQFEVGGREPFNIARYDAADGGHFAVHRDNVTPTSAHMRFAVTINLNPEEYEGGALRFPEYGPDLYAPPLGGAIVFSCTHLHEATRVTRGTRYALLAFLFGTGVV